MIELTHSVYSLTSVMMLASLGCQYLLGRLASNWLLLVAVGVVLVCSLPSAGCDILYEEVFLSLQYTAYTFSRDPFVCGSLCVLSLVVMLLSVDCWMTGLTASVAAFICSSCTALMVFSGFTVTVCTWIWRKSTCFLLRDWSLLKIIWPLLSTILQRTLYFSLLW